MKNRLLYLIILVMSLFACSHESQMTSALLQVDSLIEEDTEAAFSILVKSKDLLGDASDSERMKYYLRLADAQNKLEKPMLSDSLFFEVVNYYDNNGTNNEQMKAHYLLGCIYRDMKEAPVALQSYYDAIDKADTLSPKCDYITMMCVWGQIAELLHSQCMPHDEINAWEKYSYCASKAGLEYEKIHGYELQMRPYSLLCDTTKLLELTSEVVDLYKKAGLNDCVYQVYGYAIDVYIHRKLYDKAAECMSVYEQEPGFYLQNGEIKDRRNSYYYSKGMYALGVGQLAEAKRCFYTLDRFNQKKLSCKGFIEYYRKLGNIDSVAKYSLLLEQRLNSEYIKKSADAVINVKSMYDFSRYQRLAEINKYKANLYFLIGIIVLLVFFIVAFLSYRYHKRNMYRKNKALNETMKAHEEYKQATEIELGQMHETVNILQTKIDEEQQMNDASAFMDSDIVVRLKSQYDQLSSQDQEELFTAMKEHIPHLYNKIFVDSTLTEKEQFVAVLIRIDLPSKQIACLVGMNVIQQVTNTKRSINKKLFDDNSSSTLYDHLLTIA